MPSSEPRRPLDGRTVLITGAGDGIGAAVARSLAAHGATVVLLGRTVHKLAKVYDAIEAAGHPPPLIHAMDLEGATPQDYQALAAALEQQFGRLDGLLHNATFLGTLTPVHLYKPELWYRVMQVDLNAPFLLTQACLPLLKRCTDASLVFTTAAVGRKGRAYWGAYAAANAALENLVEVLADELEDTGVRVNSLDPGAVRTRLRALAYPGEDPRTLPAPEDIVEAYLFLLGPDSRGVRGQHLTAQALLQKVPRQP